MEFFNDIGRWMKDHAPQIAVGVGLIAGAAGTVLAIKATYDHLDPVMEQHNQQLDAVNKAAENGEIYMEGQVVPYTEKDKKTDVVKVYTKTGLELMKIYWPTIVLEGLAAASLIFCYKTMDRRNKELSVAYSTLATAFAAYKSRVKTLYGEDANARLLTIANKESVDSETGELRSEDGIDLLDDNCKIWAFETSPNMFRKDVYANRMLIMSQEKYMNHVLRQHGFITANDFYKCLGLGETVSGCHKVKIFDNNDDNRDNQFIVRLIRDGRYISWQEYLDSRIPEVILEINCDQTLGDLRKSKVIPLR